MTDAPHQLRWPRLLAIFVVFVYCTFFLVHAPQWFPAIIGQTSQEARTSIFTALHRAMTLLTGSARGSEVVTTIYLVVFAGALPLLLSRAAGRRPADLGWQKPNRLALRYFVLGFAFSCPFLLWMVQSPTIANSYLGQLRRLGFPLFAAFYFLNMLTEHLLLHGVVLGLGRPDGRWGRPAVIPPAGPGLLKTLRYLGMAVPYAGNPSQWLGLAPGCLVPMFVSALLFGMVHLGKDTRELMLAFPGGLAQAYIAFRSNSWLTPFAIHLATASMALIMMLVAN